MDLGHCLVMESLPCVEFEYLMSYGPGHAANDVSCRGDPRSSYLPDEKLQVRPYYEMTPRLMSLCAPRTCTYGDRGVHVILGERLEAD